MTTRQRTREQELRAAIRAASLDDRDYRVLDILFGKCAQWVTGVILDRFQPRSLEELARWCRRSPSTVARSLAHLERHGWVSRSIREAPGRQGKGIRYQVCVGRDCDCHPDRAEPVPGAERTRRWREKKTSDLRHNPEDVTDICVTYDVTCCHASAGQEPLSAKEGRDEGSRGEREAFTPVWALPRPAPDESWKVWPAGSIGEQENAVPSLR